MKLSAWLFVGLLFLTDGIPLSGHQQVPVAEANAAGAQLLAFEYKDFLTRNLQALNQQYEAVLLKTTGTRVERQIIANNNFGDSSHNADNEDDDDDDDDEHALHYETGAFLEIAVEAGDALHAMAGAAVGLSSGLVAYETEAPAKKAPVRKDPHGDTGTGCGKDHPGVQGTGNDACCTFDYPCLEGEGDCDSDEQCEGYLKCGTDNCAWGGSDDCCETLHCEEFLVQKMRNPHFTASSRSWRAYKVKWSSWGYGWYSSRNYRGQWIEVDLGIDHDIKSIITMGGAWWMWCTSYQMSTSTDKTTFTFVEAGRVFAGPHRGWLQKREHFKEKIRARWVRVYPTSWWWRQSLRFDIGGCPVHGKPGKDGEPGEAGPEGDLGAPGRKGAQGERGQAGVRGDKGDRGEMGLQGPAGEQGARGVAGERGQVGKPGKKGLPGDIGPVGHAGSIGDRGLDGDVGKAGERGFAGPPGKDGAVGRQGVSGDRGIKGDAGLPGIDGKQGPRGPKGDRGPRGRDGLDGLPGDNGPVGSRGNDGKNAVDGPMGPPGDSGLNGGSDNLRHIVRLESAVTAMTRKLRIATDQLRNVEVGSLKPLVPPPTMEADEPLHVLAKTQQDLSAVDTYVQHGEMGPGPSEMGPGPSETQAQARTSEQQLEWEDVGDYHDDSIDARATTPAVETIDLGPIGEAYGPAELGSTAKAHSGTGTNPDTQPQFRAQPRPIASKNLNTKDVWLTALNAKIADIQHG